MNTLAELADFIAAHGIEIQPWLPIGGVYCAFCDRCFVHVEMYRIVTEGESRSLCGTCAGRLAMIAIHRLPHDDALAAPGG